MAKDAPNTPADTTKAADAGGAWTEQEKEFYVAQVLMTSTKPIKWEEINLHGRSLRSVQVMIDKLKTRVKTKYPQFFEGNAVMSPKKRKAEDDAEDLTPTKKAKKAGSTSKAPKKGGKGAQISEEVEKAIESGEDESEPVKPVKSAKKKAATAVAKEKNGPKKSTTKKTAVVAKDDTDDEEEAAVSGAETPTEPVEQEPATETAAEDTEIDGEENASAGEQVADAEISPGGDSEN